MFKFVEQGSTSCHETVSPFSVNHASDYSRGQSIWRGAGLIVCALKGLREQEEMLGGGVGWGLSTMDSKGSLYNTPRRSALQRQRRALTIPNIRVSLLCTVLGHLF